MNDKNKKIRFDEYLVLKKLVTSRHQAADLIRRQEVKLNDRIVDKPALRLDITARQRVKLQTEHLYASRAGYKLATAAKTLGLDFRGKTVFDVGAHQGGFTDFMHRQGAAFIVAIDVGKQTLAPRLNKQANILAFNQTDVRHFKWPATVALPDFIVADLSFISLSKVLDCLLKFCHEKTAVLVLAKPQFEAEGYDLSDGVVKNQPQRREILLRLEAWFKDNGWAVSGKTDSRLPGLKGNLERFYLLKPTRLKG